MKTNEETVGLMIGNGSTTTKDICRSLGKKGISAIVVQKKEEAPIEAEETTQHWSGQPGKDLFFNGWKLLF
jgi:nitrogen fixation protein